MNNIMEPKTNFQVACQIFGSHAVGILLCLIISFCLLGLGSIIPLQIFTGIMSVIIYFFIISGPTWKLGNGDLNRVKFGRIKEDKLRGLKAGLIASVPIFIMNLLLILAKAELFPNFYVAYKLLNSHLFNIIGFIDGTFLGVKNTAYLQYVSWASIIVTCVLSTIITPLFCHINYMLGYKDIILSDRIIYKKQKKEEKES